MLELYDYQLEAVSKLKNGSILAGETGTGKSRTALAYYFFVVCGGKLKVNGKGSYEPMTNPKDLYIITTAKKRDSYEWLDELQPFMLVYGRNDIMQGVTVTVDSWNNIKKYSKVFGAFFIFDEQRVTGSGPWVKAFLDIARKNQWILLSATPGDKWLDYIPVFIANSFYRSKTDFYRRHCIFNQFTKYREVIGYYDEGILQRHRDELLVPMEVEKTTVPHHIDIWCNYDRMLYKTIWRDRWNPFENEPITETSKLFHLLRRVANDDPSRLVNLRKILESHRRCIIFYNFTYELQSIRALLTELHICTGEWNGELHTPVPDGDRWAYLVQYSAGAEGWNCISTNIVVFYSLSYSYRQTKQAEGRIDRANTPYVDLYYYVFKSKSPIDVAIMRALSNKKNFNESRFLRRKR